MDIIFMRIVCSINSKWASDLYEFIKTIPLTQLLVGVVVPIMAAWISYTLAQRATRKKEYNKLFIQIELVKNELVENGRLLSTLISKYNQKTQLKKELEFPIVFCKEILISVLNKLQKIKEEYFYFDNEVVFENPNCVYILAQRIESIDKEIAIEESNYSNDEYLKARQKSKISELKEQKEECVRELKKIKIGIFIKNY